MNRDYYAGRQRGLAEGEERAIERIIKLLEDYQSKKCKDYECFPGGRLDVHDYECGEYETSHAIALIKGENK